MHVFQVATPFSTGTGTYLPGPALLVTNEHFVRDNATVVVGREGVENQLARVVYLDPFYDLAFLQLAGPLDFPELTLSDRLPKAGTPVVSVGQHFGEHRRTDHGKIVESGRALHGIEYLLHDARSGPTLSGGGIYDSTGQLVGINMQDAPEGESQPLQQPE